MTYRESRPRNGGRGRVECTRAWRRERKQERKRKGHQLCRAGARVRRELERAPTSSLWASALRSRILCRTVVGVTSRKGSLTGSRGTGGPGLHIFLAEASQWGAPHTIFHIPPSSRPRPPRDLCWPEGALVRDAAVAGGFPLTWRGSIGGTARPWAVGGGNTAGTWLRDRGRRSGDGRTPRGLGGRPGRDRDRGVEGLRGAPSRRGESGAGCEGGRGKAMEAPPVKPRAA